MGHAGRTYSRPGWAQPISVGCLGRSTQGGIAAVQTGFRTVKREVAGPRRSGLDRRRAAPLPSKPAPTAGFLLMVRQRAPMSIQPPFVFRQRTGLSKLVLDSVQSSLPMA